MLFNLYRLIVYVNYIIGIFGFLIVKEENKKKNYKNDIYFFVSFDII